MWPLVTVRKQLDAIFMMPCLAAFFQVENLCVTMCKLSLNWKSVCHIERCMNCTQSIMANAILLWCNLCFALVFYLLQHACMHVWVCVLIIVFVYADGTDVNVIIFNSTHRIDWKFSSWKYIALISDDGWYIIFANTEKTNTNAKTKQQQQQKCEPKMKWNWTSAKKRKEKMLGRNISSHTFLWLGILCVRQYYFLFPYICVDMCVCNVNV